MVYAVVDFGVWISSAFCTKLENSPVFAMLFVKEGDELV